MSQETETITRQRRKAVIFHKILGKVVLGGMLVMAGAAVAAVIGTAIKVALGG